MTTEPQRRVDDFMATVTRYLPEEVFDYEDLRDELLAVQRSGDAMARITAGRDELPAGPHTAIIDFAEAMVLRDGAAAAEVLHALKAVRCNTISEMTLPELLGFHGRLVDAYGATEVTGGHPVAGDGDDAEVVTLPVTLSEVQGARAAGATQETVNALAGDLLERGGAVVVRKALAALGVTRVDEVPEDSLPALARMLFRGGAA